MSDKCKKILKKHPPFSCSLSNRPFTQPFLHSFKCESLSHNDSSSRHGVLILSWITNGLLYQLADTRLQQKRFFCRSVSCILCLLPVVWGKAIEMSESLPLEVPWVWKTVRKPQAYPEHVRLHIQSVLGALRDPRGRVCYWEKNCGLHCSLCWYSDLKPINQTMHVLHKPLCPSIKVS